MIAVVLGEMQESQVTALSIVPDEDDDFDFQVADADTKFLASLVRIRERLVEKAEELSIKLENQLDPGPAVRLEGKERDKARHLYVSQSKKIEAELNKLITLADNFRVHIY